ncbi:E3 ubiquitin-protein ligase KEG [Esox lucius]|uniref:E3 ubiquitin-protein ligase KEG n=1 Tax=Esox lucius TaxID=8010 RepID=UPI001477652E|nr:E3 ubiquitin-protein ligase KEG [Esox lucius]XP_010901240.2 E3 ubiquitin-protein ligase KEG [Esox lucius]XP_010901241.2 E3 ubiquitin-protein ligase KEG [Esox lucius]XP_010901243.2 E3 ubiquitin-protein ligase KEG [Esox lucius]
MVWCEDMECGVCYQPYSREERVPRVLHCRHTFCATCLETISLPKSGLLTVRCPLCRQTTCIGRGLTLHEALWVNSRLWDNISESEEEQDQVIEVMDEEEEEEEEEEGMEANVPTHAASQAKGPTPKPTRPKLKLPAFFRKFILSKPQHQERIVPVCTNVEMKSWRRLSAAETF